MWQDKPGGGVTLRPGPGSLTCSTRPLRFLVFAAASEAASLAWLTWPLTTRGKSTITKLINNSKLNFDFVTNYRYTIQTYYLLVKGMGSHLGEHWMKNLGIKQELVTLVLIVDLELVLTWNKENLLGIYIFSLPHFINLFFI